MAAKKLKHVNEDPQVVAIEKKQRELVIRRNKAQATLAELQKVPDRNLAIAAVLSDSDAEIDGPHTPVRSTERAIATNEVTVLTKALESLKDDLERAQRQARQEVAEQFRPRRKAQIKQVAKLLKQLQAIQCESVALSNEMREHGLLEISWPSACFGTHDYKMDGKADRLNAAIRTWFAAMESEGWL